MMDSPTRLNTLSRRHCIIYRSRHGNVYRWGILDIGSTNGTFVGNFKIERSELCDGEIISFGGGQGLLPGEFSPYISTDLKFRFNLITEREARQMGIVCNSEPSAANPKKRRRIVRCDDDKGDSKRVRFDSGAAKAEPGEGKAQECDTTAAATAAAADPDADPVECTICLSRYVDKATLACKHSFCFKCIRDWLLEKQSHHQFMTCPCCRTDVDTRMQVDFDDPLKSYHVYKLRVARRRASYALQSLLRRLKNKEEIIQITSGYRTDQQCVDFLRHLERYRYNPRARALYLHRAGITPTFVQSADHTHLLYAATNLGIDIASTADDDELRSAIERFMRCV